MNTVGYVKRWFSVEAGGGLTVQNGGTVGVYNTHRTTDPRISPMLLSFVFAPVLRLAAHDTLSIMGKNGRRK